MTRRSWSPERVVAAIRDRQRRSLPLDRTWREDHPLHCAAKYHFGSWHSALAAAGVPCRALRRWSKERVLAALRERISKGLSLTAVWHEDRGLYSAATAYFGSWLNAKQAVGLEVRPPKSWTKHSMLEAIRRWHRKGVPMSRVGFLDSRLYHAAGRRFGCWANALTAAGLPPGRYAWTREKIIAAIQARQSRSGHVGRRDRTLYSLACRRFGSWAAAQHAAGIEFRPHRKWNQRRVIEAIRGRYRNGPPRVSVWHEEPGLGGAAVRYFGIGARPCWPPVLSPRNASGPPSSCSVS